jgi:hypothetical protein
MTKKSEQVVMVTDWRTEHGHCRRRGRTPEYYSWQAMRERCRNPKHESFKDYGGRGITVCEQWNDFANFLTDMGLKPSRQHSIERINNNGNYEPGNCKWVTPLEQQSNVRPKTPKKRLYIGPLMKDRRFTSRYKFKQRRAA